MSISPTNGAALHLRDLDMNYDDAPVLKQVSLDVSPGEFVTLLGPSGSGKTTTLNLIAGFIRPTGGSISLDGQPIEKLAPHKRNIGMVFQHYALFPHMTAYENVAFPLRRRRVPIATLEKQVSEAFSLVQLEGYESFYPRQLSGGQQQRVAFARAIVFSPRLLLMDEPLGALDRRLREALQLEVKRLHKALGITFLYVTHDQEEALALSERIAVFNKGKIEQLGSPAELYEQPANLFVADFLGESTKIAGTVDGGSDVVTLACHQQPLRARNPNGLSSGDQAVIVIRPERLAVADARAADLNGEGNCLVGRIRDLTYLGSVQRLEVEFEAGGEAIVRQRVGENGPIAEGDRVAVSWHLDEAVLLPARQAE